MSGGGGGGVDVGVDVDVDIDVVVTWVFFVDHQRIFEIWSRIGHAIKNTKKLGHIPLVVLCVSMCACNFFFI